MDFLTSAQTGQREASTRLCARLRRSAGAEELATINRIVDEAAVFGEGPKREDPTAATVNLRVVFAPSPPGARGEPWEAQLVKEGGRWKVCGFAPTQN